MKDTINLDILSCYYIFIFFYFVSGRTVIRPKRYFFKIEKSIESTEPSRFTSAAIISISLLLPNTYPFNIEKSIASIAPSLFKSPYFTDTGVLIAFLF